MQQFDCDLLNLRKKSQKAMTTEKLKSLAKPTYPNTLLNKTDLYFGKQMITRAFMANPHSLLCYIKYN